MKKLSYLIKYGLKKRLFTKAFVISSAIIGIIILVITILPSLITSFSDGSSGESVQDNMTIVNMTTYDSGDTDLANYLVGNTNAVLIALGYNANVTFNVTTDGAFVPDVTYYDTSHDANGLIYMFINADDLLEIEVYNQGIHSALFQALTIVMQDMQRVKYAYDNPDFNYGSIDNLSPAFVPNPHASTGADSDLMAALAPILIVPMFILITFGVQVIGSDIIEEKSTKAIEIIIASVPPKTHFIAKILSIIIFEVIQLLVYFGFGILGFIINEIIAGGLSGNTGSWDAVVGSLGINVLPTLILVFVCAILGATIYCVVGAFIASLAVNQEDYQQIQTPVMMLLMLAYFGSILAGAVQSQELLLVFAYIPFFSPLVLPVMMAMGFLNWIEVSIGLAILVGSIILLMMLVSPLYRASILSYDQSSLFKRIKNTIKTAKAMKENQKLYEGNNFE